MLTPDLAQKIDAYWRAANYLSAGQIYLRDNPLLKEPLKLEHVKPRLLGHWGTTPGLNFIYAHMNRAIRQFELNAIFITGPGHGAPGIVANAYLEGSYSELYPEVGTDEDGMRHLFRQFSWPGGIPSHTAATTPGSIHEGGELGYSLVHAYGAVFDNPDLLAVCVVGDGEAETGTLAASWHSNKFLNPVRDGAVLPILHLNGYKIANPTVLARIPREELFSLFRGYGYEPIEVSADDPLQAHQEMAEALDRCVAKIRHIQQAARENENDDRPRWPMLILRTPKGWTGPKEVDGLPVEGTWRAHQVPLKDFADNPTHLRLLAAWLRSYHPQELFDEVGQLRPELAELAPAGERRMSANPHANGGKLLEDLQLPDVRDHAVTLDQPGQTLSEATRVLGAYLKDVMALNIDAANFRVFGPDETASNRLSALFEVTDRCFTGELLPTDENQAPDGRVLEVLSENLCQGWLEGYLLTGRHGLFSCYEAFTHIVDSMFNQYAKWLKTAADVPWRAPIASFNYLLTSHVWRQDHNGFSHQDPGFINHVANKKPSVVCIYMPPDANTLLAVAEHCLRSRNKVNVIVAGKQPELQWLGMDVARQHCTKGMGIWRWASSGADRGPDVVLACAGDVPTTEVLAAADLLRKHLPRLAVRVVNVVNLMTLAPPDEHPEGLGDAAFDDIFGTDSPILFAFHGYRSLIRNLMFHRSCHARLQVFGYKEEGTTTTPFDMAVLNGIDRFNLVLKTLEILPELPAEAGHLQGLVTEKLELHRSWIRDHGEDLPEVRNWRWGAGSGNVG
jgi:xylulose-5-phosphate/fructose-6-phosphate phosphoketolase